MTKRQTGEGEAAASPEPDIDSTATEPTSPYEALLAPVVLARAASALRTSEKQVRVYVQAAIDAASK
jgi:hypothetical protein